MSGTLPLELLQSGMAIEVILAQKLALMSILDLVWTCTLS